MRVCRRRRAAYSGATSGSAARSAWPGLPEAAKGPAFSAAVGLLIYPQVADFERSQGRGSVMPRMTGTGGTFQRMSQWFRDSF